MNSAVFAFLQASLQSEAQSPPSPTSPGASKEVRPGSASPPALARLAPTAVDSLDLSPEDAFPSLLAGVARSSYAAAPSPAGLFRTAPPPLPPRSRSSSTNDEDDEPGEGPLRPPPALPPRPFHSAMTLPTAPAGPRPDLPPRPATSAGTAPTTPPKLFLASLGPRNGSPVAKDAPAVGPAVRPEESSTEDEDDDGADRDPAAATVTRELATASPTPVQDAAVPDAAPPAALSTDPLARLTAAFDLGAAPPTKFHGEFSCWLMRNVLLRGYLYVLDTHLCFYARVPHASSPRRHAGFLAKRGKLGTDSTYWFVLHGSSLSCYANATDTYYPVDAVDLRDVASVELSRSNPTGLKLRIRDANGGEPNRVWRLSTDSPQAQREWFRLLQEASFLVQNTDDVRLVLPCAAFSRVAVSSSDHAARITVAYSALGGHPALPAPADEDDEEEYVFAYFGANEETVFPLLASLVPARPARHASLSDGLVPSAASPTGIKRIGASLGLGRWAAGAASPPVFVKDLYAHHRPTSAPSSPVHGSAPLATAAAAPVPALTITTEVPTTAATATSAPATPIDSPSTQQPLLGGAMNLIRRLSHRRSHSDVRVPLGGALGGSPDASCDPALLNRVDSGASLVTAPSIDAADAAAAGSTTPGPGAARRAHRRNSSLDLGRGRLASLSGAASPTSGSRPALDLVAPSASVTAAIVDSALAAVKGVAAVPGVVSDLLIRSRQPSETSVAALPPTAPSAADTQAALDAEFLATFKTADTVAVRVPGYLVRTLAHYGRLYVGKGHLAFKPSVTLLPGRRGGNCVVPRTEIVGVVPTGERGMNVAAKNGELVFQFASAEVRDHVVRALTVAVQQEGGEGEVEADPASLVQCSSILQGIKPVETAAVAQVAPPAVAVEAQPHLSVEDIDLLPQIVHEQYKVPRPPPPPMRITVMTIGTRGDVQPFIALCQGLQRAGHTVRLATHLEYQPWIESHGIAFREIKGEPAEIMQLCVDYPMFSLGFARQVYGKFRGWIGELLDTAWTACQDSDLIIEAAGALGAGYHIAEKLQIPVMRAFMMPWTRTSAFAHPFAPVQESPVVASGLGYNSTTFTLAEQAIWAATRPIINRWRRRTLGLPSVWTADLRSVPFIYGISPAVMPPPPEWPDWVHVCGYWFLPSPLNAWTPPDPLAQFLAVDPARTVYIGFGSIVVPDPDEMSRVIVASVRRAGVRAIVCRGWSDRLSSGKKSAAASTACASILELDSVPHEWLFPRVRGVVHHGGSGTTAAGLRFGVPCIIKPFFGDQFFWAARVEELGAGIAVRRLVEDKFAPALTALVSDTRIQQRAKAVGERINAEDGVETAIKAIYRDLDYARAVTRQRVAATAAGINVVHQQQAQVGSSAAVSPLPTPGAASASSNPLRRILST
ncbi:Sterol 3-beta-glucosyltransferase [Blastocladiella emersonii ATCC 22665]|nr:Sterol 3-beta-glucosyltransferase [Blastocladiella emersonii ATCC 22665]